MKKLTGFVMAISIVVSMASHEAMARNLTAKEKAIIAKAVKRELTDPESARFKWMPLANEVDMKSPDVAATYCGLVNAKNKMGGYVGDKPFMAVLGWQKGKMNAPFVMLRSDDEILLNMCAKDGYPDLSIAE